ncbi:hypothetical protein Y032_0457g1805 [Ancylostoma ceylanicum]|uniref:Uncharacterized protein n=1 Tax=Ancylostoma ceylanicum TaxID=53326 RepID=A0A016WXP7_9BILA|nr:hypothetical protein Y032_0457g1805 [Ancylostoma ceylanicum]
MSSFTLVCPSSALSKLWLQNNLHLLLDSCLTPIVRMLINASPRLAHHDLAQEPATKNTLTNLATRGKTRQVLDNNLLSLAAHRAHAPQRNSGAHYCISANSDMRKLYAE